MSNTSFIFGSQGVSRILEASHFIGFIASFSTVGVVWSGVSQSLFSSNFGLICSSFIILKLFFKI